MLEESHEIIIIIISISIIIICIITNEKQQIRYANSPFTTSIKPLSFSSWLHHPPFFVAKRVDCRCASRTVWRRAFMPLVVYLHLMPCPWEDTSNSMHPTSWSLDFFWWQIHGEKSCWSLNSWWGICFIWICIVVVFCFRLINVFVLLAVLFLGGDIGERGRWWKLVGNIPTEHFFWFGWFFACWTSEMFVFGILYLDHVSCNEWVMEQWVHWILDVYEDVEGELDVPRELGWLIMKRSACCFFGCWVGMSPFFVGVDLVDNLLVLLQLICVFFLIISNYHF